MPQLPDLVYDKRTRVAGEFFLYYNLGAAFYAGSVGMDADSDPVLNVEASCAGASTPPASGFGAVRARVGLKKSSPTTWGAGGITATLPALAPQDQAAEASAAFAANPSSAVGNGLPGDSVDLITLPGVAGDVLICFDQGLTVELGDQFKPIPRKFNPVDHYVRQRVSNTITLTDLYSNGLEGLARLRGRDITLIGKFFPDGSAIPSEIHYFTNVRLTVPTNVPDDVNESVTNAATGTFRDRLIFSAEPS
jgi:hypothetical protein